MREKINRIIESRVQIAIFLFLFIFLVKLPTMGYDYHWDSTVVAAQSKYYTEHGFLSVPPGIILHTPFLTWLVAILYTIVGDSPFAANLLIAVFSFLGAYFIYLIGKDIYSAKVGIIASILLIISPMYFSLSGQLLYDVPLTAMTLAVLYFHLKRNTKLYLLSASILVVTKEPGFLAIIAILIYSAIKKDRIKKLFLYASPLILLAAWGLFVLSNLNKIGAGGYISELPQSHVLIIQKFLAILYQIGVWHYNWLLLAVILYMASKKPSQHNWKLILIQQYRIIPFGRATPFLITALLYLLVFSFSPTFLLPKYILPIVPAFSLLAANAVSKIKNKKQYLFLLCIALLFISTYRFNWDLKGSIEDPVFQGLLKDKPIASIRSSELSLDYVDILGVQGSALTYLFENHKGSTIVSTYPLAEDASISTNVGRRQWKANNITVLTLPSADNIKKADIIIVESYGNFDSGILDTFKNRPIIKSFEKNTKKILVYGKPN